MVDIKSRLTKAEARLAVGDAGRPLAVYFRSADGVLRDRGGEEIDATAARETRVVIFTRRPDDGASS